MKARISAPMDQRFKMSILLRDNTEPVSDGVIRYINGYSDERIRSEIGGDNLDIKTIQNFRIKALGVLEEKSQVLTNTKMSARLVDAEQRLAWTIDAFNKLCDRLDVPDLKIKGE